MVGSQHFCDLEVGTLRKRPVTLDQRPDVVECEVVNAVNECDRVRVTHAHTGEGEVGAIHRERALHDFFAAEIHRDLVGAKTRHPHVHLNPSHSIVVVEKLCRNPAPTGLPGESPARAQTCV